jgi:SPP1 family predicted phage head-tail adaptor
MRTGSLRHYVEIHALTIIEDDIGNQTEEWAKVAEAWASIEPLKGDEYFAAASTQAQVSHKVTLRPPGIEITPANRIIFGSRTLEIESVINVREQNRELQLMCKEKVGG